MTAGPRRNLPAWRQQRILEEIEQHGYVLVSDFPGRLGVSEVTVRRDMQALEEQGLARRVRGGLVSLSMLAGRTPKDSDVLMTKTQRYLQRTAKALHEGDLGLAARSVALVADLVDQMARQRTVWR